MLPYLLAAIIGAGGPTGIITLKSGDVELTLDSASCFTVVTIKSDGVPLTVNAGGQGAVTFPKDGNWIGGAMKNGGEEQVEELTIIVDGEVVDLAPPQTIEGDTIIVSKTSMLATIRHTAVTTLSAGRIMQNHTFDFTEDIDLKSFYAVIYSFVPAMTNWIAEDQTGAIASGDFAGDGGHPFNGFAAWFAQFNADTGKGMTVHYQTPIPGTTSIWDAAGYRKIYTQPMGGAIAKGTTLDYKIVMEPFAAEAATWQETATTNASALKAAFPIEVVEVPEQPNVLYDEGIPERGFMTLNTDNYSVILQAESAWTMDQIRYKETLVAGATGHFGTVLVPQGGDWIGTGHTEGGREVVHTLALKVDGVDTPIAVGTSVTGHQIELVKTSTIHKFAATHTLTVKDDEIIERAQLRATEAHDLKRMYLFMHCWEPNTTTYLAELADGEEVTGELVADEGMEVNADAWWVAQYMPEASLGILQYMPEVATGPGSMTMVWDQPRYHKCYIQTNLERSIAADEEIDYTVVVKMIEGEDGSWTATRAGVADLIERYPKVEIEEVEAE